MDFNKDDKICRKCKNYEVCILYTGHGCLQDMKKMKKANSLKQNSESGNNIKENIRKDVNMSGNLDNFTKNEITS